MLKQCLGNGFRGCPDVYEDRGVVRNECRNALADIRLFLAGDNSSRFITDILDAGRQQGATMRSGQQSAVAQFVQIFADCLRASSSGLWPRPVLRRSCSLGMAGPAQCCRCASLPVESDRPAADRLTAERFHL